MGGVLPKGKGNKKEKNQSNCVLPEKKVVPLPKVNYSENTLKCIHSIKIDYCTNLVIPLDNNVFAVALDSGEIILYKIKYQPNNNDQLYSCDQILIIEIPDNEPVKSITKFGNTINDDNNNKIIKIIAVGGSFTFIKIILGLVNKYEIIQNVVVQDMRNYLQNVFLLTSENEEKICVAFEDSLYKFNFNINEQKFDDKFGKLNISNVNTIGQGAKNGLIILESKGAIVFYKYNGKDLDKIKTISNNSSADIPNDQKSSIIKINDYYSGINVFDKLFIIDVVYNQIVTTILIEKHVFSFGYCKSLNDHYFVLCIFEPNSFNWIGQMINLENEEKNTINKKLINPVCRSIFDINSIDYINNIISLTIEPEKSEESKNGKQDNIEIVLSCGSDKRINIFFK